MLIFITKKIKINSDFRNVLQIILFYVFPPSQDPVRHHVLPLVAVSSAKPMLFILWYPGNDALNCDILFPQPRHFG